MPLTASGTRPSSAYGPAMPSNDLPALLLGPALAAVLGLLFLWLAMRNERKLRLIDDLPTSKTTGVFIGLVELDGRVRCDDPLISHLTEQPCVLHRWSVQESWSKWETETYRDSDGKTQTRQVHKSGWTTVASGGDDMPFDLVDAAGALRVIPAGADIEAVETLDLTCGTSDPLYYAKGPREAISNSDLRRQFSETALPVGVTVHVIGQARERRDIVAAEVAADRDAPLFVITVRGERALVSSYRWAVIGWWLLGLVVSLAASVLISPNGIENQDAAITRGIIALTGFLTATGMGWLWMAHNSLVELRQRVLQAWANIDVQLKRRADLIPNLITIVQAAGGHERSTQEAVALLRNQRVATRTGKAGPDPQACGALLVGLNERYPTLRADAAFRSLGSALSDTEERIALARSYLNDIATHLNTRIESVPDNLVAALTGIRTQPLMQADGFERHAPRITL